MPFEEWSTLERLLVIATDTPTAVQPAIATLLQALPKTALTVLGCESGWSAAACLPTEVHPWPALEQHPEELYRAIDWLRVGQFEAAIVFTAPGQSPYTLAYLGYLAGIPVRMGQSLEFGGGVLSHCYLPPDELEPVNPHLHLLKSAGLPIANPGASLPELMTSRS